MDESAEPRVLMLGMGWFPATLGGLNRYFRGLLEQLPEARAVVVGPRGDAPPSVAVVADARAPILRRVAGFWRESSRAARSSELLDAHFALYAALPILLGRAGRLPTVFHFQGPWAQENVVAGDASRLRHALRSALERRVHARVDAHVVLSSAFRRVLVERYRVRPWEVHVWPPAVALERFTPGDREAARTALGLAPQAFVAVCARRLTPRMGFEVLLDAWAQLESPQGSMLLIAGEGPLGESLAGRAELPPLAGRVRLLGGVEDAQLLELYRAADVAVVPSLALEGFGLVVLEAAACGTPSIVTDAGGLPEAARPLDPSLVVPAGDAGALARRLQEAAQGALPDRRRTRAFAEGYSWPALAERHRGLYRRLIARERDGRPRVVYLDHVARLSGGELALMRVLRHMCGVNAHVILGEEGPLAERLVAAGISVEVMPVEPSLRDLRRGSVRPGAASIAGGARTLAHSARLAARLRRLRPDLVHTNSLKAGVYGGLAARAAGVPLVWHVRDRISSDYLPAGAARGVRLLVRALAAGVIANSQETLATLRLPDGARSWVIPASVEAVEHERAPRAGTTFGMLGRIAPWKGQDLFLRAFASAFANGEERAALIGSALFGEESYERELRELVRSLGLDGRVEFRGFREDVWAELAGIDVLVHASTIPEPFGTVVLEGMAAGLAVIAPDAGGPATMIRDGECGRLFPIGDEQALAAAMRALDGDAAERARLGEAARRVAEAYRPEVIAQRIEAAYGELLARAR